MVGTPTLSDKAFRFYTTVEYWSNLLERIQATQPGDRVVLMAMDFSMTGPVVQQLVDTAVAAIKRGVTVQLVIDARSFLADSKTGRLGPLWFRGDLTRVPKLFRPRFAALQLIERSGGEVHIINPAKRPLANPFSGRSHIKLSLINDYIFLGGCNLDGNERIDLMVGWQDGHTADYLFTLVQRIIDQQHVMHALGGKDIVHPLDAHTMLLIDAGVRRQSIIFEHALALIDAAQQSITITCQFFPNSITARHLAAAHKRGVQVRILFAHPSKHPGLLGYGQYFNVWRERQRVPAELFGGGLSKDDPMLHAKLIATEQAVLIGSHNYVQAGVSLGTAEIALLSHSALLAQAAIATLERELPKG